MLDAVDIRFNQRIHWYTVTKAYQNYAPFWKITVLGMKNHPVGAGRNILSLAHAGLFVQRVITTPCPAMKEC
jgi:hypothetical protein